MSISLYSEGAAGEVTGSKHILEVDGERVLVDCGAFQGRRKESDEKNRRGVSSPKSIAATILTHAHYDHCGLLPLLVKQGYNGNVMATPATRDLAALIMADSARIQERDADYLQRQATKHGEEFDWHPLYTVDDAAQALEQIVAISYHREFSAGLHVRATFYDAGHILGSSTVHATATVGSNNQTRILFSGDLGRPNSAIIRDPETPPPVDYVVVESTYGNRLHDPATDAIDRLEEIITKTVKRGGKVIIPAFAIERTQELVYHLHILAKDNRIPDVPIWIDSPMAISATGIFHAHPECYDRETYDEFLKEGENPFGFDDLHFSRSVEESKKLNRMKKPAIIISASGMCEAGRIQHHLIHAVSDNRNTILVVGFMAKHTLGRRIVERRDTVRIHGKEFPLRAGVEVINAFSAHADYSEIGDWLSTLDRSQLKGIFLVHGEEEAQSHLSQHLAGLGLPDPVSIEYGERYSL